MDKARYHIKRQRYSQNVFHGCKNDASAHVDCGWLHYSGLYNCIDYLLDNVRNFNYLPFDMIY